MRRKTSLEDFGRKEGELVTTAEQSAFSALKLVLIHESAVRACILNVRQESTTQTRSDFPSAIDSTVTATHSGIIYHNITFWVATNCVYVKFKCFSERIIKIQ
mmetsp:Transcript_15054/g.46763  ORF Transcript_15054/g.46763 Transcript_15054/m.46763 type:complete len:103 (-) Transcript_15054:235-543(-)